MESNQRAHGPTLLKVKSWLKKKKCVEKYTFNGENPSIIIPSLMHLLSDIIKISFIDY